MKKTFKVLSFIFVVVLLVTLGCVATFAEDASVAEVNGTGYTTLQAAIEAAGEGETVKLLMDISAEEGINVAADMDVIIDLGGHTVNGWFLVYGKATIMNGTITNDDVKSGIESNGAEADLTVEGLEITTNRHALRIDGGKALIKSGKYATVAGGTVSGYAVSIGSDTLPTTVVIDGGEFRGSADAQTLGSTAVTIKDARCNVTINDGAFVSGGNMGGVSYSVENYGTLTLNGGIFSVKPTQVPATIKEGMVWGTVSEGDYAYYQVVDAVAENVTTNKLYATLAEAVAAAVHGDEVVLLCDVLDGTDINTGKKSITINLGGYTYSSKGTVFTTGSTNEAEKWIGETVIKNGTIKVYDCGVRNSYGHLVLDGVIIDATGETANANGGFGLTLPCAVKTTLKGGTQINMKDIDAESIPFNTAIRFMKSDDGAWEVVLEDCSINGYISFEQTNDKNVKISLTEDTVLPRNEKGYLDIRYRYADCSNITYIIPDAAAAAAIGDILLRPGDSVVYADNAPFVNTALIPLYARLHHTGVYAIGELAVSSNNVERVYYSTEWIGDAPTLTYNVAPFESNALLYGFAATNIAEIAATSAQATPVSSFKNEFTYDIVVLAEVGGKLQTVVIPNNLFVCAEPAWGTCEITAASIIVNDPTKIYGADGLIFNWGPQTGDMPAVADFASVDGAKITIAWVTGPEFTNAGTHTAEFIVKAANHADLSISYNVEINPVNLKTLSYRLKYDNVEYDSGLYENWIYFTYLGTEFSYLGNFDEYGYHGKNAGTYTYTVQGINNFCGEVSVEWTILTASENSITLPALSEGATEYTWAYGQSDFNATAKFGTVMYQLCNKKGEPTADADPMTLDQLKAMDYRNNIYYVYAYVEETDNANGVPNYVGCKSDVIAIRVTRATLYDDTLLDLLVQYLESTNPSPKYTAGEMKYTFNGLDQSAAIIADWNPTLEGFKAFVAEYVADANANKTEGADDIAITVPDVDIFEGFVQMSAGVTNYKESFGIRFGRSYGNNNYNNISKSVYYYLNKVEITVVPDGGTLTYNGQDQFVTTYTIANEEELGEALTTYFRDNFTVKTSAAVHYVGVDVVNKILTKSAPADYIIEYAEGGTLTVEPRILEVTLNAADKVYTYDAMVHTYGPSVVANYKGAEGDTVLVSANSANLLTGINAGTYKADASNLMVTAQDAAGADVSNCYKIEVIGSAEANLIINPASVTLTVNNQTIKYGDPIDAIEVDQMGNVGGVMVETKIECAYEGLLTVPGEYSIYLDYDAEAYPNYAISYEIAKITVEKADFTATIENITLYYNGSAQVATPVVEYAGIINKQIPNAPVYFTYGAGAVEDETGDNMAIGTPIDMTAENFTEIGGTNLYAVLSVPNHNDVVVEFTVQVVVNSDVDSDAFDVVFNNAIYAPNTTYNAMDFLASITINGEDVKKFAQVVGTADQAGTHKVEIKITGGNYADAFVSADWTVEKLLIDADAVKIDMTQSLKNVYDGNSHTIYASVELKGKEYQVYYQEATYVGKYLLSATGVCENPNYAVDSMDLPSFEYEVLEAYAPMIPGSTVAIGGSYSILFYVPYGVIDQYEEGAVQLIGSRAGYEDLTLEVLMKDNNKQCYVFSYAHIAPNELDNVVTATLYINGVNTGVSKVKSVSDYAYTTIDKNLKSTAVADQALVKALVALLNYGAEAQKAYGETENLINAALANEKYAAINGADYTVCEKETLESTKKFGDEYKDTGVDMGSSFVLTNSVYFAVLTKNMPADITVKVTPEGAAAFTIDYSEDMGAYVHELSFLELTSKLFVEILDKDCNLICSNTYSAEGYAAKNQDNTLANAMVDVGILMSAYVDALATH